MSADFLLSFLRTLVVILISIDIHEFSHALTATWLGDDLPRYQGRLTLNPMAHLDPMGTMMIVLSSLSGFGFGWGRPVQVNPVRLRHGPAVGMGIVAIAGPISNLVLAMLAAIAYHSTSFAHLMNRSLFELFVTFMLVNVGLALFNLIPIFPLDGFRVALALLRLVRGRTALQVAYRLESTAAYGPQLFILLILVDQV
ncbi:MAG: site-2 protease family protein, partial [Chloroflexi bacterium]|nr:site-2 protease family protein [Chloroflexota bacterium]